MSFEGEFGKTSNITVDQISYDSLSGYIDAFSRLRVSNPETIFDSKQISDNLPLYYDDQEVSGSGTTSVYQQNRASSSLIVSNLTAGRRVRQTKRRFNYQPAKTQLSVFTFVMGISTAGVAKRVGLFDDDNGVFIEQDFDGLYYFVIRSSVSGVPVDSKVAVSAANIDPTTAALIDFTKIQLMTIDFSWLGTGSVKFGFNIGDNFHYIHSFENANILDSVYMTTPNLPVRYEIENDGSGASASLEHICSSVISEGGHQKTGIARYFTRGSNGLSIPANGVWYPLISLRLKDLYKGITVEPISANVILNDTSIYEVALFINPTIGGVDAPVWTSKPNSSLEYDVTRTNLNTLSGGTDTVGSVLQQSTNDVSLSAGELNNLFLIGEMIDGTKDELVLAVRKLSGNPSTAYASITMRETL